MKRYCLALDLIDDPQLIAEYEQWHSSENSWPEIMASIVNSGIIDMQIYRTGNRLTMVMETEDWFSFEEKSKADADNPKVQEWEKLMWKYQQQLPWAKSGEKWIMMKKIFQL